MSTTRGSTIVLPVPSLRGWFEAGHGQLTCEPSFRETAALPAQSPIDTERIISHAWTGWRARPSSLNRRVRWPAPRPRPSNPHRQAPAPAVSSPEAYQTPTAAGTPVRKPQLSLKAVPSHTVTLRRQASDNP